MLLSQRRYKSQVLQLGQIADDDDATCDASNRGVYQYVEVKEHRMLLSQRRDFKVFTIVPYRNWGRSWMMTTQCAAEFHEGVYEYVEVRLRKPC